MPSVVESKPITKGSKIIQSGLIKMCLFPLNNRISTNKTVRLT